MSNYGNEQKTRLSEFNKLFPNAKKGHDWYPSICIIHLGGIGRCKEDEGCQQCKKQFWEEAVEQ